MSFGKKLKQKMDEKGIKQSDLSKAANVPKTTLSSMINRDNTNVDINVLIRICKILNCRPEDFSDEILSAANQDSLPILCDDEKNLLDYYRNFNNEGKKKLLEYATDLSEMDKYKKCSDIEQDIV